MGKKVLVILLVVLLLGAGAWGGWKLLNKDKGHGYAEPGGEFSAEEFMGTEDGEPLAPYAPDSLDKVIVGWDDRVKVYDPTEYPFSAIANMHVYAKCGCEWDCCGFMVSPKGMLTSADALLCQAHGSSVDWIDMYFGYKSSRNYLYHFNGYFHYWYKTEYWDHFSDKYNYALMLLDEPVGNRVGWFGTWPLSDNDLLNTWVIIAGYRDGDLMYDWGYVGFDDPDVIYYEIDTVSGYGGCPIFFFTSDDVYATGINVSQDYYYEWNYGRRITGQMMNDMRYYHLLD